jgi:lysophospholipase L1-like esterase
MIKKTGQLSLKKRILFSIILLVGIIGFIEVFASIYYYWGLSAEQRNMVETILALKAAEEYDVVRYISHPYFNYVCNPEYRFSSGYKPHNSRGFRQPEWPERKEPDAIRIIALGGSTTYGAHYEEEQGVWPALLEKRLQVLYPDVKIEVFNLGVPSYTTHEILGIMAMLAPSLAPDIVIIHVGANEAFGSCYPDEGGPDNTNFRFAWNYRPLPDMIKFGMRKSFLLRSVGILWLSREGRLPGAMISATQYPVPPKEEIIENSRKATGKYFRQNLTTLIALSRHIDAVPVFLTHPFHPGWNPQDTYTQSVILALIRNNQIIQEIGKEYHAVVVDLYTQMQNPELFSDALHATPEGMSMKAQLIVDQIRPVVSQLYEQMQRKKDSRSLANSGSLKENHQ